MLGGKRQSAPPLTHEDHARLAEEALAHPAGHGGPEGARASAAAHAALALYKLLLRDG